MHTCKVLEEEEKNDVETQTQISIKLTFIAVCFLKKKCALVRKIYQHSLGIPSLFFDKPLEALFGSLGKLMLVGTVKSFQN